MKDKIKEWLDKKQNFEYNSFLGGEVQVMDKDALAIIIHDCLTDITPQWISEIKAGCAIEGGLYFWSHPNGYPSIVRATKDGLYESAVEVEWMYFHELKGSLYGPLPEPPK